MTVPATVCDWSFDFKDYGDCIFNSTLHRTSIKTIQEPQPAADGGEEEEGAGGTGSTQFCGLFDLLVNCLLTGGHGVTNTNCQFAFLLLTTVCKTAVVK